MIVSQPQAQSGEKIFGTFYLSRNPVWQAFHQLPPGANAPYNFRGMPVCLIMNPANIRKGFGIDVGNFGNATADETMTAAGVIETKLVIGNQAGGVENVWVNVQTYGVHDRVLMNGGAGEIDLITLWAFGGGPNDFATGFKKISLIFPRLLTGIFQFDGPPGAGETINLDGTATAAGTWTSAPGVSTAQVGDFLDLGAHSFLGFTPRENLTPLADLPVVAGARRGFIMCMGMPFPMS